MKQLFDEAMSGALTVIAVFVIIFGGILVMVTDGENRSFKKTLIMFFVAVPVGFLAGMIAFEVFGKVGVSCGIASVSTLLSERIVLSIVNSNINFGAMIDKAIHNLIDKFTK